MYKAIIDSNIIIDYMMRRIPFYDNSKRIIELCEDETIKGYVTTSILMDLHYIFRRKVHSSETANMAIKELLKVFDVIDVTKDDIVNSLKNNNGDFEDGVVESCSINNGIDCIITRNVKDFNNKKIDIYMPEDILLKIDK